MRHRARLLLLATLARRGPGRTPSDNGIDHEPRSSDAIADNRGGAVHGDHIVPNGWSSRLRPQAGDGRRLDLVAEGKPVLAGVQDEAADEAVAGLVLYTGEHWLSLGDKIEAAPIASLW